MNFNMTDMGKINHYLGIEFNKIILVLHENVKVVLLIWHAIDKNGN